MRISIQHALLALVLCPALAQAWGPEGHRIVGDLAQRELTPQAAAAVADLLRGEPYPTLAGVANWADTMRQDDPARFKLTAAWHYDDLPRGDCHFVAQRDCPDGNCVTVAIDKQRKILSDPSQPRQARVDALKFLIHFVGDTHQPFHAGYPDDRGGNTFQISLRTNIPPPAYMRDQYINGVQGTNLHAVWDNYIIANHDPDAAHYATDLARRASSLESNAPADETSTAGGPVEWAEESCRVIGSESLYPRDHRMDSVYLEAMRPIAERRLIQAGHRLAATLNAALGSAPHG
jgi:nuclease S1